MSALALFLLAAAAGACGTLAARALAFRVGMVSRPNPIVAQHTRTVAYLGGAGVAAGWAAALLAAPRLGFAAEAPGLPLAALAVGAAAFLAIGVWDDARPLSPAAKLLLQGAAAAGAAAGGIVLPVTGSGGVDAALSAFWIVVVVNAVNLTDVCDGLVGGVAVVALLLLAAASPAVRGPALAAAGATAGFLVFNLPPASVFLGDAGAHLLGFVLAALTLADARGLALPHAAARAALVTGVFLFELAFLVAARRRKGIPFWRGSPDHVSLRLQAAGLSRWQTDAVAWSAAAALGGAALLLPRVPAAGRAVLLAAALAGLAAAWRALLRWEVPPRPPRAAVEGG
jgi:UDP-GlcNAc:undecaprenyl-phosphate GlcNAc-1-phosphate transferase